MNEVLLPSNENKELKPMTIGCIPILQVSSLMLLVASIVALCYAKYMLGALTFFIFSWELNEARVNKYAAGVLVWYAAVIIMFACFISLLDITMTQNVTRKTLGAILGVLIVLFLMFISTQWPEHSSVYTATIAICHIIGSSLLIYGVSSG